MSTIKDDVKNTFGEWALNPRTGKKNLRPRFKGLIEYALDPANKGQLSDMFTNFYGYSLFNTMILSRQCIMLKGKLSPVLCPSKWEKLGCKLNKSATPLTALVPQMKKITIERVNDDGVTEKETIQVPAFFKWVDKFYMLEDTDCKDISKVVKVGKIEINPEAICKALSIKIIPFNMMDGNCGGYSKVDTKEIALNPYFNQNDSVMMLTLFHEIAHSILHHKDRKDRDLSRANREVEAELVAFLVCASVNKDLNVDNSIAYIKGWLSKSKTGFTETMSEHAMQTASQILQVIKKTQK